jgi:ATP/maltotriose-dependent transcriptional regulator MalT
MGAHEAVQQEAADRRLRLVQHHPQEAAAVLAPARGGASPAWPVEPLTWGETRVLRYLATHMSAREIAAGLCVSANTVKTHQRHPCWKLGAHSRHEAMHRACAIGLLAASPADPRHRSEMRHGLRFCVARPGNGRPGRGGSFG